MQINKHISLLEIAPGKYIIISKKHSITDEVENIERKTNKRERERKRRGKTLKSVKTASEKLISQLTKFARRQRKCNIESTERCGDTSYTLTQGKH